MAFWSSVFGLFVGDIDFRGVALVMSFWSVANMVGRCPFPDCCGAGAPSLGWETPLTDHDSRGVSAVPMPVANAELLSDCILVGLRGWFLSDFPISAKSVYCAI